MVCRILVLAILCSTLSKASLAEDWAAEYLDKLRERGWHDVALEYLERANEDPLASPKFLARVELEIAITRSDLARRTISGDQRQSLLAEAAEGLRDFAKQNPDSPDYLIALKKLGNLLADQGLTLLSKADQLTPESASKQIRDEARSLIEEATSTLKQAEEAIDQRLATLSQGGPGQTGKEILKERQELEDNQAEIRFLLANLIFEKARSYPAGSVDRREVLEAAADGFARLQKEYENKLVGFYAQLYEGRCYQDMGNCREALKIYERLMSQPLGQPEFRKLLARAVRHRVECHLAGNSIDLAIEECNEWLARSRSEELEQEEWLAVSFLLAKAYKQKIEDGDTDGNVSRMRSEVRKLLREVARHAGEFQSEARAALALAEGSGTKQIEVSNFSDAFAAGKTAIEQMGSSQLAAKLAANNNPNAVADLKQQASENREEAIRYFQSAVDYGSAEVPQDELVEARYYLCRLYWEDGRSDEAAALGLEIAQQHPDSRYAPTAAQVTLAVYERLFLEVQSSANGEKIASASAKLREIAELIIDRWNDTPAAVTATNLLISIALRENNYEDANRLLADLPEGSRGLASMNLGGALWTRYLQRSSTTSGELDKETKELKTQAAKLLGEGYKALSAKTDVNLSQAADIVYYVQLLLSEGNADLALTVLENPTIGPLAQLDKEEFSSNSAFTLAIYKAALQAYLSVDPPQEKKAIAMMERLEQTTGTSEKAQKQLTSIYVNLGLQLQEEIKALTASGDQAKARSVAAAFVSLIDRVARRGDSQSWSVRTWLAETSLQLGASLRGADARRYYEQAEKAYRSLLASAEKDPKNASALAVLAVRKKLGECLLAQGKYAPAVEQFTTALADNPKILELQHATASALQQWGTSESDPGKIEEAIQGALPQADCRNLVLGWLKMANVSDLAMRSII